MGSGVSVERGGELRVGSGLSVERGVAGGIWLECRGGRGVAGGICSQCREGSHLSHRASILEIQSGTCRLRSSCGSGMDGNTLSTTRSSCET